MSDQERVPGIVRLGGHVLPSEALQERRGEYYEPMRQQRLRGLRESAGVFRGLRHRTSAGASELRDDSERRCELFSKLAAPGLLQPVRQHLVHVHHGHVLDQEHGFVHGLRTKEFRLIKHEVAT